MAAPGDKEVLSSILSQYKLQASALTTLVLESCNEQLRKDAVGTLNNTFEKQKQIFDYMSSKGWYPVETASNQEMLKAQHQLSTNQ